MQGDIFQLEQMTVPSADSQKLASLAPGGPRSAGILVAVAPVEPESPLVAIYNEDDLSHLLYTSVATHHESLRMAAVPDFKSMRTTVTAHPLDILEHPSGTHTPTSESDESAIFDCESDEEDLIIPPSPDRPRADSFCSVDAEFPVFLGRQTETVVHQPQPQKPMLTRSKPSHSCLQTPSRGWTKSALAKHVKFVSDARHVTTIEGPMMSWWPASVDLMEHEWAEAVDTELTPRRNIAVDHHVSNIDGPMMSWWPAINQEWSELFYE